FFSLFTLNFVLAILGFAYLGLAVIYHLRRTRRLFYGLVASVIFIPGGVALAYGIAFSILKRALISTGAKS
ncbi:MAG TPA: hypothetical protein VED00_00020, partial [archaeon]|nr:hypothetical protein [archaeon]